jgi:hypothetical protein
MATLPRLIMQLGAFAALVVAVAVFCPKAARAQSSDAGSADTGPNSAKPALGSGASAQSDSSDADTDSDSDTPSSGQYSIHQALKSFDTKPRDGDDVFERASETFPAFCKDWERRLHDRQLNNLENMTWKDANGYKTGTYLGYSPIKSCNCKRSTGGVPIGELTYQETEYYLSGRTVEEARHADPKPVGITNTTEIFRWDHTKWDDGR